MVNDPGIEQERPNDLLNSFDPVLWKDWLWCWWRDVLSVFAIFNWRVNMWVMLRFGWFDVSYFLKEFGNVVGHIEGDFARSVVPVKIDSAKLFCTFIRRYFIFAFQGTLEMSHVFFSHALNCKIVDYQREGDRPCVVLP